MASGLAKRLSAIDTALTDDLYEKLLILRTTDAKGNTIERERRTTVNHAMKSCRRAWNVVARRHPGKLPLVNPFAQMGLRSSGRETPTSTYDDLVAFRAKAIELGLSYPELTAELDAIKRQRIGGLTLCRDWGDRSPWPTWPKPDEPDFTTSAARSKKSSGPQVCATNCHSHHSGMAVSPRAAMPS